MSGNDWAQHQPLQRTDIRSTIALSHKGRDAALVIRSRSTGVGIHANKMMSGPPTRNSLPEPLLFIMPCAYGVPTQYETHVWE